MRGPISAMIWELWRISRPELVIRLSGTIGLMLLISIAAQTLSDAQIQAIRGFVVGFLLLTSILSQTWLGEFDATNRGFCFRLGFIRPVSTFTLFIVPMIFCMFSAVLSYIIPAVCLNCLIQDCVPVAGPAQITGFAGAIIVSAVWSFPGRIEKLLVLSVTAAAAVWLIRRQLGPQDVDNPWILQMGTSDFFSISHWRSLQLLSVVTVVCGLAIIGIDRQRHGDFPSLINAFKAAFVQNSTRATGKPDNWRPFPNSLTAQFWYEWRRSGNTVLFLGAIAPLFILSFLYAVRLTDPGWTYDIRVWLVALAVCPIVYLFVGIDGAVGLSQTQGTVKLSVFDAVLGLTNDQLIMIKLFVTAASSITAWLFMLTAALAQTQISGNWSEWQTIGHQIAPAIRNLSWSWWIASVSSLIFSFVSIGSLLLSLGLWMPANHGRFLSAFILLYAHFSALVWDAKHAWAYKFWWLVYCCVIALAIALVSLLLLRKAIATRSLSRHLFAVVFGMWTISTTLTVATALKIITELPFEIPLPVLVLSGSMLLTPLASVAMAPLVYASYRHQ